MADVFHDWTRSGVFRLGSGAPVAGRLQAALPVTLADLANPADSRGGATPFELLGPGDVAGLNPAAITARYPQPGAGDAEETKSAHLELSAADLPWRYTPEATTDDPTAMAHLRPWLVLVVGTPDEVITGPRGTVQLRAGVLAAHDLRDSHRWAHVQEHEGGFAARILSPRDLLAQQDYVAVLVPAFRLDGAGVGAQLVDSWQPGDVSARLPCFDSWRFRTGGEGDFAQFAERLVAVNAGTLGGFGVAGVLVPAGDRTDTAVRGALGLAEGVPPDADPLDPAVSGWLATLTGPVAGPAGRWVLTLPDYGAPWPSAGGAPAGGWRDQLASDPRRRLAAGLGAWAGIEWQQRIADAAAAQAGALDLASARIRQLTAGLAATRALWRTRLPTAPLARLALLAPMLARLPASGGSVLDQIAGRTPTLVAELFSTAACRVLRPGTARSSLTRPGAADLATVLGLAGDCPPGAPRDPLDDLLLGDATVNRDRAARAVEALADAARDRVPDRVDVLDALLNAWRQRGAPPSAELVAALAGLGEDQASFVRLRRAVAADQDDDLQGLLGLVAPDHADDGCRPVDMTALAAAVVDAVDPTVGRPLVVDRVVGTLGGLAEPVLAPPDFSPELDLPLWKFLDERARDWLLPGIGELPSDSVVAVASNAVFVDAFLLGANAQALGELRWRDIPVTTGWTPLRRFWSRIGAEGAPATDIRPVGGLPPLPAWPESSPLGAAEHAAVALPAGATRDELVVVFRTELFRRYPTTVVYLVPADRVAGQVSWVGVPDVDTPGTRVDPVLTGTVGADVTFFGFPVPPSAAGDQWVVLEEPPPGVRFRTKPPFDAATEPAKYHAWQAKLEATDDSAAYAAAGFSQPVRVFLGKLLG